MTNVTVRRKTKETDINIVLDTDTTSVSTGIGFFDHMLTALLFYARLNAEVTVTGDTHVDAHHTVEDTGIVLGQALAQRLGDKSGIARFAHSVIPMDEALAMVAVDICGRAFLAFDADFVQERVGDYDSCLTVEFFRALCQHAGLTLHIRALAGQNTHHITEAIFKATGAALRSAMAVDATRAVNSTKGNLG